MKYCVKNQLNLFEFHDSKFSLISFEENELCICSEHMNIHKNAKENPHDYDMDISLSKISCENTEILSYEPMRAYTRDDNGNWHTNDPQIIHKGDKAKENFINDLKDGFYLNYVDIKQFDKRTEIEICATEPKCFYAVLSFSNVIIEWDSYCGKAWYELNE